MKPLRLWLGSLLLALGVVWLLDAAGALSAGAVIAGWWPIAVVGLGVRNLPLGTEAAAEMGPPAPAVDRPGPDLR